MSATSCSSTRSPPPQRIAHDMRLRRRAVRRVLRARGRLAGRQRDGAAPAQLGPLHHRRLRRVAVRAAGAHAGRAPLVAPRLHSPARDAEPARRPVAARPGASSARRLGARCSRCPATHLHLYGKPDGAARPQDGPPDGHRARAPSVARATALDAAAAARHRSVLTHGDRWATIPPPSSARRSCSPPGELVAFPTETVYGLGARADDDAAVAKIFAAKGRPADHPLIVHVARQRAGARASPRDLPLVAERLMAAFWPGPLTRDRRRVRRDVATAAAGGQATIGLRCPAHPVAHALLARRWRLGVPGIAAPSANRFGRVSPTRAAARDRRVRRRAAGARRRRLRHRHRIEHRRLLARSAGAAAPGRADARTDRGGGRRAARSSRTPMRRARRARCSRTTRRAPSCA